MKVSPQRIIYANPCKQSSHIKYAAKHQVARMTFDNELELHKVKAIYPTAKWVPKNISHVHGEKMLCKYAQLLYTAWQVRSAYPLKFISEFCCDLL